MRKIFLIVILFTISRTLISCCKDEGYDFRWSSMMVTNLNVSVDRPTPLTSNTSRAKDYGFRLKFQDERIVSTLGSGFSYNAAMAFDCVPFFINKDSIVAIDVITRFDFDNTHLGGSSVKEYLQARVTDFYNYQPQYQFQPLNEYLYFLNRNQDKLIHNNSLDVKFKTLPSKLGEHRFIVNVIFKSGRILTDSTSVTLQ